MTRHASDQAPRPGSRTSGSRGPFIVRLSRLAVVAALAFATSAVLWLCMAGVPGFLAKGIVAAASAKGFSLEYERMLLRLPAGIDIRGLGLFKKGLVGPPALSAGRLRLDFRVISRRGLHRLKALEISDGRLRSDAGMEVFFGAGSQDGHESELDIEVSMERFDFRGSWIESVSGNVRFDGRTFQVRDIVGMVGSGTGSGPVEARFAGSRNAGVYRGTIRSRFDPNELKGWLASINMAPLVKLIDSFRFPLIPPGIQVEFTGRYGEDWRMDLDGSCSGREFERHGVYVSSGSAIVAVNLRQDAKSVTLDPLIGHRPEGDVRIRFVVDIIGDTVAFEGVTSADPVASARLASPDGWELLRDFSFGGPTRCFARGVINTTNSALSEFEAGIEAKSLTFAGFFADECSFGVTREKGATVVSDLHASMCGGKLSGGMRFARPEEGSNTSYRVDCKAEGMAFRSVAEWLFGKGGSKESLRGEFSARLAVSGESGDGKESKMNGAGSFRIEGENILRLPLFGQLSAMLVELVPGLEYVLRQNTAFGAFTIENGRAKSGDVRIEGDILSLKGDGEYDIAAGSLDFDIELRFLKKKTLVGDMLQIVMLPVTKMFRVRLTGTPDDPEWKSVNF